MCKLVARLVTILLLQSFPCHGLIYKIMVLQYTHDNFVYKMITQCETIHNAVVLVVDREGNVLHNIVVLKTN